MQSWGQGALLIPVHVPNPWSLLFSPTLWDHQVPPDIKRHLSFAVWSSQVNQTKNKGNIKDR